MYSTFQKPFIRREGYKNTLYRHILTAADSTFFDSLLLLVDSLYEHAYADFYQIYVYDLGLTSDQHHLLEGIPRVKTIRIPYRELNEDYIKNYFFKIDLLYLSQYFVPTNFEKTLFLYLDAGVLVNRSLGPVWNMIRSAGYFIADMADRRAYNKTGDNIRLFNHFPDELLDSGLSTDFDLLSKPLLRPGIFGFKLHSDFFVNVIDKCYQLSRTSPEYLRGPKFFHRMLFNRAPLFRRLRVFHEAETIDRGTDDFIGFRHDQFLYSYLIHQGGYDYLSASGYVMDISDMASSKRTYEGKKSIVLHRTDIQGKYKEIFLIHRNTLACDVDFDKLANWFEFDNEEVAEKIRGKMVAIVGPAKHVYKTKAGNFIDGFDVVCRVNKYRMDSRFTENIGARCDVLVHCISETEETGGKINKVEFTNVDPCIISPYALLDDFDKESTFQPYYGNIHNFSNYFKKYSHKIFAPTNDAYIKLERLLKSRPNTGFAGILILLDFQPTMLYVTGFTFFACGYHISYRQETKHEVIQKMETSGFHDQRAQQDFFVTRVANHPRLRMDNELLQIVNTRLLEMARVGEGRIVIMGSGPSLRGFPFRRLRNEATASFNRAYIMYEKENFYPCFYFAIDKAVLLNCLNDIEQLLDSPILKFILLECAETKHLATHDKVTLVEKTKENAKYFGDVATFAIHYFIRQGYKRFDIYGCDANYREDLDELNVDVERNDNDPAQRVVLKPRKGAVDPNHFLPNYFGEETQYSLPRTSNHHKCWESIKHLSEEQRVRICFRTPSKVDHLFSFIASDDSPVGSYVVKPTSEYVLSKGVAQGARTGGSQRGQEENKTSSSLSAGDISTRLHIRRSNKNEILTPAERYIPTRSQIQKWLTMPIVKQIRMYLTSPTAAVLITGMALTGAGFSDAVWNVWLAASGLALIGLVVAKEAILWRWRYEQIRRNLKDLALALAAERNRAEKALTEAGAAIERADKATETAGAARAQHTQLVQKANSFNVSIFQGFSRQLSDQDIDRLIRFWGPTLGLELKRNTLGYLAHRVCLVEDTCSGRLATSVQDALLRILLAQSISGEHLSILEIGTLFGVNLAVLYETCRGRFPNIQLTAIDPLEGYYDKSVDDVLTGIPVSRKIFEHNMRRMDVPKTNVTLIQALSTAKSALKKASARKYNSLIIDGHHSYKGVKFDFDHYSSFVETGGYILFDDYGAAEWPEVGAFVDQEVRSHSGVEFVGADWRTAVFRVVQPGRDGS